MVMHDDRSVTTNIEAPITFEFTSCLCWVLVADTTMNVDYFERDESTIDDEHDRVELAC